MPNGTGTRTVLRRGHVLSMDERIGDLAEGDVLIEDDRILDVGPGLEVGAGVEEIDATGCLVLPGFVDTHRHMWQGGLRGVATADTLPSYLEHVCGELGPALTVRDLYDGNRLSARSALNAGVTTLQDVSNAQSTPERTDALVAALRDSGVRAVFAYGKDYPAIVAGGTALPEDARRVREQVLHDDDALVTMALVTEPGEDEGSLHNARLAADLGLRSTMHVSGAFPVGRLERIGALRPGTTYIHGNGLSRTDLDLIAASGGSLSVSPAVEQMMGHGTPMFGPAAAAGVPLSLSVDVESAVASDLFTQMRAAYQVARSQFLAGDGPAVTVRDVVRWATADGARALGLHDRIGSLAPGKQADVVLLRADRLGAFPVHDPYATVALHMDTSHVEVVLVAGVVRKAAGQPAGSGTTRAPAGSPVSTFAP